MVLRYVCTVFDKWDIFELELATCKDWLDVIFYT